MRSFKDNKTLPGSFRKGDEDFFIEVYKRYWYALFLSAYRRVKDKAVAEGLVQDLFLKLWQKRDSVDVEQIERYLFSAIRNATIDYLKHQMVAGKYLDYQKTYYSMSRNATEEMVELRDLEENLEKGLQKLAGKSEKIFRLYRLQQWSIEKIARHFNLSEKTVHYHLTRSQKFIRTYLQQFTLLIVLLIGRA